MPYTLSADGSLVAVISGDDINARVISVAQAKYEMLSDSQRYVEQHWETLLQLLPVQPQSAYIRLTISK